MSSRLLCSVAASVLLVSAVEAAPIRAIMRMADAGKKMALMTKAKALSVAGKLQGLRSYAVAPKAVMAKIQKLGLSDKIRGQVSSAPKFLEELRTGLSPNHPFLVGLKSLGKADREKFMAIAFEKADIAKLIVADPAAAFAKAGFPVELPNLSVLEPEIFDTSLVEAKLRNLGVDEKLRKRILGNRHLLDRLEMELPKGRVFSQYFDALGVKERTKFLQRALKDGRLHKLVAADAAKALKRAGVAVPSLRPTLDVLRRTLGDLKISDRLRSKVLTSGELATHLRMGLQEGQVFRRQFVTLSERHKRIFLERAARNVNIAGMIATDPTKAFRAAKVRLPRELRKLERPLDTFVAKLDIGKRTKRRLKGKPDLVAHLQIAMVPGHPFFAYFGCLESRLRDRFLSRAIRNKRIVPFITDDPVRAFRMAGFRIK